jgi:hypothetical protein
MEHAMILEFPQAGERLVGLADVRAVREADPSDLTTTIKRMRGRGDLWITWVLMAYGGHCPSYAINILAFRERKFAHETIYFGGLREPLAWRVQRVEPLD